MSHATAVVATPHYAATRVGRTVLLAGGNAFDAAVSVALAIGVVQPYHSGLGGGCAISYRTAQGESGAVDARGRAPAAMTLDLFQNEQGQPVHERAGAGGLAVLTPGLLAGVHTLHGRYGRLPWAQVVRVVEPLAAAGFPADANLARVAQLPASRSKLDRFAAGAPVGRLLAQGQRLVQPALARTLERIAVAPADFYHGDMAAALAAVTQAHGGVMTAADLAAFQPRERALTRGTYRGWEIFAPGLPTIGALQTLLSLGILAQFDLAANEWGSARHLHLVAEAIKLSYMARAGLDDAVRGPALAASATIADLAARLRTDSALPFAPAPSDLGSSTSHFCVADHQGNVVSQTQTVRSHYGSGIVDPVTGIVLNDLAGDFSLQVDRVTDQGIRYAGRYNLVAPGIAPASSQSPIIAVHPPTGDLVAVGAAGGPRIVSAVVQALVNLMDFGMEAAAAVAAPRIHCHGPVLEVEPGVEPAEVADLRRLGHQVETMPAMARLQLIRRGPEGWTGAADPRGPGAAAVLSGPGG